MNPTPVTVRLPAVLAQMSGGERSIAVEGGTLAEALEDLVLRRPALGLHIFDESGALRGNILCFCNDVCRRRSDGLDDPIRAGDTITLLNSVSGG